MTTSSSKYISTDTSNNPTGAAGSTTARSPGSASSAPGSVASASTNPTAPCAELVISARE